MTARLPLVYNPNTGGYQNLPTGDTLLATVLGLGVFATQVQARAAVIPNAITSLLTLDHEVIGDNGGGTYYSVNSSSGLLDQFTDGGGRHWQLQGTPSLPQLGVYGNGTDETTALQLVFTQGFAPITNQDMVIEFSAPLFIYKCESGLVGPRNHIPWRWSTSGNPRRGRMELVYTGGNIPGTYLLTVAGYCSLGNSGLIFAGQTGYALENIILSDFTIRASTIGVEANGIALLAIDGAQDNNLGTTRSIEISRVAVRDIAGNCWYFEGGLFDYHLYEPVGNNTDASDTFLWNPNGENLGEGWLHDAYAVGGGIGFSGAYNVHLISAKSQAASGVDVTGYCIVNSFEHETATGTIGSGSFGIRVTKDSNIVDANSISHVASGVQIGEGDSNNVLGYDIRVGNIASSTVGVNVTTGTGARRGNISVGNFGTAVGTNIVNSAEATGQTVWLGGQRIYSADVNTQLTQLATPQTLAASGQILPAQQVVFITSAADVTLTNPAMSAPSPADPTYSCREVTIINIGAFNMTLPHSSGFQNKGAVAVVLGPSTNVTLARYLFANGHYTQVS